jgi:hypothetical protein
MTPVQRALLVREGSRQWAGSLLEDLVQATPTKLELRQWARKNPQGFFNAMSTVGRLAGFEQQINVKHDINMRIYDMSDSELDAEIARAMLELQKKNAVEAELLKVEDKK